MGSQRYVLLGLAHPRSGWFADLAQWANSSSIPVELVKCLSAEELRARLVSGRAFSAAIMDANLPAVDRDLIDCGIRADCPTLMVDSSRRQRDWLSLGANTVLSPQLERSSLVDALRQHARPIGTVDDVVRGLSDDEVCMHLGRVAAVCGPGGTGTSTAAIALAQSLAHRRIGGRVLLADFCRRAEQAMLHDAGDVVPGVQELVDAHRTGRPDASEIVALTFHVVERGYDLLLGLRKPTAWTALRPKAFEASFRSLREAYDIVVCDIEGDLEGERAGGSMDVEERNVMARTTALQADVVFAIGAVGMKGVHSLSQLRDELVSYGVPSSRLIPVFNRAPGTRVPGPN